MPILLPLDHGVNFRDLGGYQTKDGQKLKPNKVIRAGSLSNLSEHDLNYLAEYGLLHDVDFRSSEERENAPDKVPTGAIYHFAPVFPEDETKSTSKDRMAKQFFTDPEAGFNNMVRAYHDIVLADSAKKAYRHFFDVLLENSDEKRSVLFHCSAGKDRTGMGAIYLLTALGVDDKTIKRDYLASNKYIAPWAERQLVEKKLPEKYPEVYLKNLKALGSVNETYLETAMKVMQKEYGSLENYLHHELALSNEQVKDLKQIYLEEV